MTTTQIPLSPLKVPSKLAGTPRQRPKYAVTVKDRAGKEVLLGDPKVTRALLALMDAHAVKGGAACHWGGPAAFAEIMSALHGKMFLESAVREKNWFDLFNFVNDAGHTENGIYALRANLGFGGLTFDDLWKFRSFESPLTGHGESHVYPQGVLLSNGPLASAFPQAQGLAVADRFAGHKERITICTISDGASMEGEAREAFASIPGLASHGKINPFIMILSDNNTKLGGRIDRDSFSMGPTFQALTTMGWKTIHCENGHDLQEVYSVIEGAIEEACTNPTRPLFLHFKTIKGYGVKSTENSSSGGHGFPLKKNDPAIVAFIEEIFHGQVPEEFRSLCQLALASPPGKESAAVKGDAKEVKTEKAQAGFGRATEKAVLQGLPVFSVSSDLQGSTGMDAFHKRFPERFIDIGVAEANMVSMAAGLSKGGLIPIVDTFAQFGITKGNLPLTMAALSQSPVIAVFSHTGFQDAADGASHQATTYLAAVSSIPNTTVISCSCSKEAEVFMEEAILRIKKDREAGQDGKSCVFFVGRENFPVCYKDDTTYSWGKAQVLHRPELRPHLVLVATGPMVKKAMDAVSLLEQEGIYPIVINLPFINLPDVETVGHALANSGSKLITIEDHQIVGGMGAQLSHALSLAGKNFKLRSLGIKGHFGRSAYLADQLYDHYGLGVRDIVQACREMLSDT